MPIVRFTGRFFDEGTRPSSHGVIRVYNGNAAVYERHQAIVDAQAFVDGHEAKQLKAVAKLLERGLAVSSIETS